MKFDLYNQNNYKVSVMKILELSEELAKEFDFVRVDWMLYQNKLYFEELTFTPYSGFIKFLNEKFNFRLGNLLKLKG